MTTQTTPAPVRIAQALYEATRHTGRLVSHSETQWNSATFSGAQDTFTIRFDGEFARSSAALLCDQIEVDDIEVPGGLVVEMTAETKPYAHDHIDVVVTALMLGDQPEETCAVHRQPVSRCPPTCDHGGRV
jgi:hypothetical protein